MEEEVNFARCWEGRATCAIVLWYNINYISVESLFKCMLFNIKSSGWSIAFSASAVSQILLGNYYFSFKSPNLLCESAWKCSLGVKTWRIKCLLQYTQLVKKIPVAWAMLLDAVPAVCMRPNLMTYGKVIG